MFIPLRSFMIFAGLGLSFAGSPAEPLTITLAAPTPPPSEAFHLGTAKRPDGATLTLDSQSLRRDDRPWIPVMGEYHFSRYPASDWREELMKMKAGGIDIVATYCFWIHHEEVEGTWNWEGQRNLHEFVRLCGDVGLNVIVRCGPWAHGEVRNGGLPDWVVNHKDWKIRTTDEGFLKQTRQLYTQIAEQLKGQLWKDGGPVIGIQLDNEYYGPAEYLLALKKIAREVGLDVPICTRTGWPQLTTPMPFGEIVPLYGAYAEGFWDRETTSMPGQYWAAFRFSRLRTDENIANEQLGRHAVQDESDAARYPYLTCEVGGGMVPSYHRRILIKPQDVEATVLIKLGSGSTLPGYYMYHGGTNPDGKLTTLMESQSTPTTNWNDLPVKSYDFQAPIGEYGQLRYHYHQLRRLHLFLADFGSALANYPMTLPDRRPEGKDDLTTLRWTARSDGKSGFVFVNNYERQKAMPANKGVQFDLKLADGNSLLFPAEPIDIPADARFIWPFNLDLGSGFRLRYATAQPICAVTVGKTRTIFFSETLGVPAVFSIEGEAAPRPVGPSLNPAFVLKGTDGTSVRVVLLDEATSLRLYKANWLGHERVFITRAGLVVDGDKVRLTAPERRFLTMSVYPAPDHLDLTGSQAGVFLRLMPEPPPVVNAETQLESIQAAGPAREIPLGKASKPVAAEPTDADFEKAAVWKIKLPADLDLSNDPILRLSYVGDVARVTLDGKLLTDNFYNGTVFDIGLRRYGPEILHGDLRVAVLPLRKDAVTGPNPPIYLQEEARPPFGEKEMMADVSKAEIVPRYQVEISPSKEP